MRSVTLSRRELLSALLGAPLASLACARRPRSVPGSLLGARLELGHRLLDLSVEKVSARAERVSVLIVGSGPSGLAAAWRLERLGLKDYRVLDLERVAGGTSTSGHDGVVPYPWGAHYVPVPRREQRELATLLEEIGAVRVAADGTPEGIEAARVRAPEERLFLDGRWIEGLFPTPRASASDHAELARFEAEIRKFVGFRDAQGRRAFTLPMRHCSDAAELVALDRLSARAWLDQLGFRSPLLRWYAEYACRDDYGASLERTSAWAMLFYFCARVAEPGAESAPFLTWPEGNGRVVSHLSRRVGDRLSLNRLVTDVVPGPSGVEVVAFDAAQNRAVRYLADDVILAVPKLVCRRILRPFRDAPPSHLSEFQYSAWLVANLHLADRPGSRGFPFAWDNVLFDSPALGYVVATHQTLADFGPTVWTYYRPLWEHAEHESRALLRSLDHATAVDGILTDLGRAHVGLERLVQRIDIYRWGHAMITPRPGFIWGGARAKACEPLGRVAFAHSDSSGLALLEEAFDRGLLAADAVLRRRGVEVEQTG
jgi:protoporphyrinogen oxidase